MDTSCTNYLAQRAAVTDAIDQAEIELYDQGLLVEEDPRDADAVAAFIEGLLDSSPFANWHGVPQVILDLPEDSALAWHCSHRNGSVHLHSLLTDTWLLLNLTAAWLTPGHSDGPRFCRVLVTLVGFVLGDGAADILSRAFEDHGIEMLPDDRRAA